MEENIWNTDENMITYKIEFCDHLLTQLLT